MLVRFDKKKRKQWIGFNDTWFMVIGVIILSFVTDYIFSNSFSRYPFGEAILRWSTSLFFSIFNWSIIREMMIWLRKKYPLLKDNSKRIALLFLAIVSTVIFVDVIGGKLISWLWNLSYNPSSRSRVIVPVIIISTMIMAIYEAIYFYIRLKKAIREEERAKQAVIQTQLDILRNQAQPHFLFNTLNTLRDIIEENPKAEAMEFVDKIADVYRFILESGNAHVIPLRDELKFARSYLHIQSERFGDNLKVHWNLTNAFLDDMIVPMSLQLLLENAIKHNTISKAKPLCVEVAIKEDYLTVTNRIQPKSTQLPSTKLGLKNITERYALISPKGLEIERKDGNFRVALPLLRQTD